MGNRHRIGSLLAVTVAALAVTVGVALAASSPSGTVARRDASEPGSKIERGPAIADARRRLRTFDPPPGSHKVASLPKSLHLNGPGLRPDSPRYIDVHAFWISSEPVQSARAYLAKHTPPGAGHSSSGWEGGRGGNYRWDFGYSWPELANVADNRELLVGVVARPGGGSALRADAQATYLEPKPKDEQIPAGVGYLEAVESLEGHSTRVVGTAAATKIEAVSQLIDGFPIVQDNGAVECGAIPSERVTLKAIFRASQDGPVVAETNQELPAGYCDWIGLSVEGKEGRLLYDEGEGLTKDLQNLLGRKYKTPLTAGIEEV